MGQDEGAAVVGRHHRRRHLGRRREVVALGGDADQVGVGGGVQPVLDVEVVARRAADPARVRRGDHEVEDRVVVLGVVGLGPHLTHRAEAEGLDAVLDEYSDLVHGTILPHIWQKINEGCHSCHSWRELDGGMITAMTYLIVFLLVAAVMSAETIRLLLHDGRGPQRPPGSHFEDPRFRSPVAR